MIEVDSLSRRYGGKIAVENVSFAIAANEIVGLLGHNGAGKTTVMRMLSGYLEPSAGSIVINGRNLASEAAVMQRELGYLPENPPFYPEMMVADYLDYAATLKGLAGKERNRAVREALAATDLERSALELIAPLSRGLRQRVGVAQAILGNPRLLILDEPTNGLDPQQADAMRQLIRRLSARSTVIISTHLMQEVEALCNRVLVLRQGQLALDRSLAQLHESRILVLYAGQGQQDLAACLEGLSQVSKVRQGQVEGDAREFELEIVAGADMDLAAGEVAQCVVSAGGRLVRLQPLAPDLESIFREVNSLEG